MGSSVTPPREGLLATTFAYYERNAEGYFRATHDANLSAIYQSFTRKLPTGGSILDAGSGSGRDTLAFTRSGYSVSAFDSSPALCKLSTEFTGIETRVRSFQEVHEEKEFDGVWACASLLHVPESELADAIYRLVRALKADGVLYMSFKHGAGERVAGDGRFFVDMTEARLRRLLHGLAGLKLERMWKTLGEGRFEGQGVWLNTLVLKRGSERSDDG